MKKTLLTLSISSAVVFTPFSLISCSGINEEIKISLPILKNDLPYTTLTANEYLNQLEKMSIKDQLSNLFDSTSQLNENNTQDLTILLEGNKLSIKIILKSEYIFNNNERTFTVTTNAFKDSSLPGATEIKVPELLINLPYSSMTVSQFNDQLEKETLEKQIITLFGSTAEINGKVLSINSTVNTVNKTRLNIGITLKKEYIFIGGNNFHSFETKDFLDKPIVTPIVINDPQLLTILPYKTKTANEFYNELNAFSIEGKIRRLFNSNNELTLNNVNDIVLQIENRKLKITITLKNNFIFKSNNSKDLSILTNDFILKIKYPSLSTNLPYATMNTFQFQQFITQKPTTEQITYLFGNTTDLTWDQILGSIQLHPINNNIKLIVNIVLKEGFVFDIIGSPNEVNLETGEFLPLV
ncbi:MAG: hypothetical protein ACRDAW_01205 [Metamycoplasmataceae bacterium]